MEEKQKCIWCEKQNILNDSKSSRYFCRNCLEKINEENIPLSFSEFKKMLENEHEYFEEESYRKITAKLALEIALKVRNVNVFLNPVEAKRITTLQLKNHDVERINDVSKMLRVLARHMYIQKTKTNEVRDYVQEKMKNVKGSVIFPKKNFE